MRYYVNTKDGDRIYIQKLPVKIVNRYSFRVNYNNDYFDILGHTFSIYDIVAEPEGKHWIPLAIIGAIIGLFVGSFRGYVIIIPFALLGACVGAIRTSNEKYKAEQFNFKNY